MKNNDFMRLALELAREALALGEIPVGCVIARGGEIVGRGYNRRETDKNATAHAEAVAINEACGNLGGWRLTDCALFVTLEPCPMCAGAIVNARIPRVVFGAYDPKGGAFGGLFDLRTLGVTHVPDVSGGILEDECSELLTEFFKKNRRSSGNTKPLHL